MMSTLPHSIKEDYPGFILNDEIWIAPESDSSSGSLVVVSEEAALRNSEEILQLKEGCSYEYEILDESKQLKGLEGIIHPSRKKPHRGRITPRNYVGRLPLSIISSSGQTQMFAVEVRSSKSDYRTEYRKMLMDIALESTELLIRHSSPVAQQFAVDFGHDSDSLYQRFSFVKSMVDSDEFENAMQKIFNAPISRWKTETEERDSRRTKKMGCAQIRQIASSKNRMSVPDRHPLSSTIESIPRRLHTKANNETLDNPENRFIKHTLLEFSRFSGFICQTIENSNNQKPLVFYEAFNLKNKLSEYLNHNIFREVSQIKTLPLNNTVLQRKEGYREVFRIWLMYDLAAKLTWNGLDRDTYHIGKRDVATLYEYWLFFKLLRLVESIFEIDPCETQNLIQKTSDGLELQLKSGQHVAIEGNYSHKSRNLKFKYSYNRTFTYAEYPQSGSWTQSLRPDYSLSFWPADFTEIEAESQEIIIHIHFDAKYKVDDLRYLTHSNRSERVQTEKQDLDDEKDLEKSGSYKRADLLKMHAYKDAIRRTAGAYVLYPGTDNSPSFKGFHEIIPGLGAFAVSPSNNTDGIENVKQFILTVLDHYTNRITQREIKSFYTFSIMNEPLNISIHEQVPEYTTNNSGEKFRHKPLIDLNVLIGYVQDKQKEWIINHGYYNIRIDREITPQIAGADYLVLYHKAKNKKLELWKNGLFRIKGHPVIKSKKWLIQNNYPNPSMDEYFVFEISPKIDEWSLDKVGDIYLKKDESLYRPITRVLPEIMS